MKHLYFCRHGLSQAQVDKVWGGQNDAALTNQGHTEAHSAGKELQVLVICEHPDWLHGADEVCYLLGFLSKLPGWAQYNYKSTRVSTFKQIYPGIPLYTTWFLSKLPR